MTAATITAVRTCRCRHGAQWHVGETYCVTSGCRCLSLYVPSEFEQSTDAEKTTVLAAFGADPHEHLIPGLGVTR